MALELFIQLLPVAARAQHPNLNLNLNNRQVVFPALQFQLHRAVIRNIRHHRWIRSMKMLPVLQSLFQFQAVVQNITAAAVNQNTLRQAVLLCQRLRSFLPVARRHSRNVIMTNKFQMPEFQVCHWPSQLFRRRQLTWCTHHNASIQHQFTLQFIQSQLVEAQAVCHHIASRIRQHRMFCQHKRSFIRHQVYRNASAKAVVATLSAAEVHQLSFRSLQLAVVRAFRITAQTISILVQLAASLLQLSLIQLAAVIRQHRNTFMKAHHQMQVVSAALLCIHRLAYLDHSLVHASAIQAHSILASHPEFRLAWHPQVCQASCRNQNAWLVSKLKMCTHRARKAAVYTLINIIQAVDWLVLTFNQRPDHSEKLSRGKRARNGLRNQK